MTQDQISILLPLFKAEVIDPVAHYSQVNPEDYHELDWYAITVGWALAKALTPEDAINFAAHVRYSTYLA